MDTADQLQRLGLPANATVLDVKAQWRRLAMRHHPDRGGDTVKFNELRQIVTQLLRAMTTPKPCPACNKTGKVIVRFGVNQVPVICDQCRGMGYVS